MLAETKILSSILILFRSISPSKYQNKKWRKNQSWYVNGKKNECEKYQIKNLKKLPNHEKIINNTGMRFNKITNELVFSKIFKDKDYGFFLTEDFDGHFKFNDIDHYFNLKFVVDKGGSQTRTLKQVNDFIFFGQNKFLDKYPDKKIKFINIIDGDCIHNYDKQIKYLKKLCNNHKEKIFIGDLKEYVSLFIQ